MWPRGPIYSDIAEEHNGKGAGRRNPYSQRFLRPHSIKRAAYLLLLLLLLFGLARLYYRLTDDFRLANIRYPLPFAAPWPPLMLSPAEQSDLRTILDQSFTYIGKGSQCYAFASQDQQYVLKFFKFKHLKPNLLIDLLPPLPLLKEFKQKNIERKKKKLMALFNGYDLAYRENRQSSGLLYLHLTPTPQAGWKTAVIDKLGLQREIDLDEVVFMIQKKGETLRDRLKRLLQQQRLPEAKQSLAGILAMYLAEYKRGLFDHDHGVLCNTGFIGEVPFHLDAGKLSRDPRIQSAELYQKDLQLILLKIEGWLKTAYPQYYPELSQFLWQEYQAQIQGACT